MKRAKLDKKYKWGAILLVSILLIAAAVYLFDLYSGPTELEERIRVYSYRQVGQVDYEVNYSPNQLVSITQGAPLRAYLADSTETIQTDFLYSFVGQREAELTGELEVKASISAYIGKERYLVWQENYQLLEPKIFKNQAKEMAINEEIEIPFADYLKLSQEIQEQTKFIPEELELMVKYQLKLTAATDKGIIEESFTPELLIPLRGKTFIVGGNLKGNKEDGILQVEKIPTPLLVEKRLAAAIAMGFLSLLLFIIAIFTEDRNKDQTWLEKQTALLLRKHGDRIVSYKAGPETSNAGRVFAVSAFEELLKLADELGRPILYQEHQQGEVAFFVLADDTYVFKLKPQLEALRKVKEGVLNV